MLLGLYAEFVALGKRLFGLAHDEASLLGLLCMASPVTCVLVNSGALAIVMCGWLMFLGHRLFWHPRNSVRILGLVILAASFQLNSNLVFALALDVVYLWRNPGQRAQRWLWFGLLFLVAASVYATMRVLAPPVQLFADYNQLLSPFKSDDVRRMLRAGVLFATWGVIPLTALCALAVALAAQRWGGLQRAGPVAPAGMHDAKEQWWGCILAALFLCLAAAFPYVMVGKGPALFTYTGMGDGLTQQVLRATYPGLLAPNWASTSLRHAMLFAPALALLTWFLVRALAQRLAHKPSALSPRALFLLVLPLFLVWVLPNYKNKLEMQYAEASLVKAFSALPAAPAGIVEMRYSPVTDWMIWPSAGTGILRQAWGSSAYYTLFYALDVYRDSMQWSYHTEFKNIDGLKSPLIQRSMGIQGFPGEECVTRYQAVLPKADGLDVWLAALMPWKVVPAQISLVASECRPGQTMPNPTPDKALIR